MKTLRCPRCGGGLATSIGPLHPMEAVAAEMLEQGAILRCSNCGSYLTDASEIECPKCRNKTLATSIEGSPRGKLTSRKRSGRVSCTSCGWEQKLTSG